MSILTAENIVVDGILAGIDLQMAAGQSLAIVGENGAGKSTLLAVLSGALLPDRGTVSRPAAFAWMAEGSPLDAGVKGSAWLRLHARQPDWDPSLAEALLAALPVPLDRPAEALSLGQRSRLGLLLTLPHRAPLLILDDPFLGLDPGGRAAAQSFIARVADESRALLFATADLGSAGRLTTHMALLRSGRPLELAPTEHWEESARLAGLPLEELVAMRLNAGTAA